MESLSEAAAGPAPDFLAWRDELSRRSEQIATGTVATVGWGQVLERVANSRRTR